MSLAEAPRPAVPSQRPFAAPLLPRVPLRLRRPRPSDDLRASVGDAAAYSLMVGVGETYFAAFALALGTGQTVAGLFATLPMLAGATLHLVTPRYLQKVRSFKQWSVWTVGLQATALLLLPLAALLTGSVATCWLFALAALYWAGGQACSPAWNTWIEDLVPRRLRANFFACRSRISQFCTLLGFVIGGCMLQFGKASGWLLAAFAAIFLLGASCRFVSAWFLSRQSEPERGRYRPRSVPLRDVFKRPVGGGTPLVLYLLLVQTAVQISGPYFAPYMLAQQGLSYVSFMVLIGIAYVGKVLALPLWGRVAHAGGARRLLWIGGTSIVPVAALWIFADGFAAWHVDLSLRVGSTNIPLHLSAEFAYLCSVQLLSGIVWAAYELAMLLMFFEAIPRRDRPCMITYYNFGNAAAQVLGGLIGAGILQLGQETHAAYLALFGISSLLRLCTVPLLRQSPARCQVKAARIAT